MKKLAKILAIVLSVCVLCGIAVISVNAATTDGAANEFLDASKISTLTNDAKQFVINGLAYEYDETVGSLTSLQDLNKFASFDVVGTQNKYQQVLPLADPNPTKDPPKLSVYYASSLTSAAGNRILGKHDYTVIDFDVATQSFFFSSEIDYISVGIYPASSYAYFARILRDSNNNFYVSADNKLDANDVQIPVAGAWSHFSVVIKTNDADYAKSDAHLYLNGTYVGTTTIALSAPDAATLYGMGIFVFEFTGLSKTGEPKTAKYDFCVDNFAVNYYTNGYDAANAEVENTLTTYFSSGDYTTKSLTTLNDVIYNTDYVNGNHTATSDWDDIVVNLEIDGETTKYASLAAAEAAIKNMNASDLNGAKIYTTVDVDADTLLPSGVKNFSIICNGAKATGTDYVLQNYFNMADGTNVYVENLMESVSNSNITDLKKFDYDSSEWDPGNQNGSDNFLQDFANSNGLNKYWTVMNDDVPSATLGGTACPYTSWTRYNLADVKFTVYDIDVSNIYFNENVKSIRFGGFDSSKYYFWPANIISDANREKFYLSTDETLSANDVLLSSDSNVWNHITIVISSNKFYTFLDGELVGTIENTTYTNVDRFCFGMNVDSKKFADAKVQFSMDNIVARKYGANYTSENYYGLDEYIGELSTTNKSLYDCADVVYTRDYIYKYPVAEQFAATVETANGTVTKHFVIGNAVDVITDGATVETRKNINNLVIPDSIETLTVKCLDGAKFSYTGAYKVVESTEAGVTTYTLTKSTYATVTWLDADGTTLYTDEKAIVGNKVTIPSAVTNGLKTQGTARWQWNAGGEFAEFDISAAIFEGNVTIKPLAITVTWKNTTDGTLATEYYFIGSKIAAYDTSAFDTLKEDGVGGWYDIAYATWESGGNAMNDTAFTAEADIVFTPKKIPVITPEFKMNLTLNERIWMNAYWIIPDNNSNISNIVFSSNLNKQDPNYFTYDLENVKTIDGNDYYWLEISTAGAYAATGVLRFYLDFDVSYGGEIYELNYSANVPIADYVEKAMEGNCGSETNALLLNVCRYMIEAYNYSGTENTWADIKTKLLDNHKTCACLEDLDTAIPEAKDDSLTYSSKLNGYLAGYAFDLSEPDANTGRIFVKDTRLVFYVPEGEEVMVTATLKGIVGTKYNQDIVITLEEFGTWNDAQNNVYDVYATPLNSLAIYNMTEVVTITVEKAGEDPVSGTYSLAEYIYYNQDINVVKALYTLAEAAKAYKLEEVAAQ